MFNLNTHNEMSKSFADGLGKAVLIIASAMVSADESSRRERAERESIGLLTVRSTDIEKLRHSTLFYRSGQVRYIDNDSYFRSDMYLFGATFRAFAGKKVTQFEVTETSALAEGAVLRCRYNNGTQWNNGYVTVHVSRY